MKLRDICLIQSGGTPSRSKKEYWKDGDIPWVKISDFSGKFLKTTEEQITEQGLDCSSAKLFAKGTILYTIFATLGEVYILDIEAATNQAIAGISIIDDAVDRNYLYYFLASLKEQVNSIGRGVAQNNINLSILRDIEIPLPNRSTQEQFAYNLGRIDEIIALCKQQLKEADKLVKSRFIEMFGDPMHNEKGWPFAVLTDVCSSIFGGGTPSKSHLEYFTGDIPWVSPKDMKASIVSDSMDHITHEAIEHSTTNLVPANSVLMVIRSGILKHTLPVAINSVPVTINQDIKAFVPNEKITSSFMMHFFKAIETDVLAVVRSVTADNIDFKAFQQRKIILPPLELQQQFTVFVQATDKSKLTIQKSLNELEILKKSLMQQYFG
ncbi:MAG: restriction endonuclease subunit S [Lachnospiraceae bacterium]|nr:restriction endonuclease subunit S [Lachnospiraceae bacterium]